MPDSPPPYAAKLVDNRETDLPPAYDFPLGFDIGNEHIKVPLVSFEDIKGHLSLMGAIMSWKERVGSLNFESDGRRLPQMPEDKDLRWKWFVGLAVERFLLWCSSLKAVDGETLEEHILPPPDVLMVWHAYMLNPLWYSEDCVRVPQCSNLKKVGESFSYMMSRLPESLSLAPSGQRVETWTRRCRVPFDPLHSAAEMLEKKIACPRCDSDLSVAYMKSDESGYLQSGFRSSCINASCGLSITKSSLAAGKLARDLVSGEDAGMGQYLAGTMHTKYKLNYESRGERVKRSVLQSKSLRPTKRMSRSEWRKQILEKNKYSSSLLRDAMSSTMKGKGGLLLERIMACYQDVLPFSVDLVSAVLRQGIFIEKMHRLGWINPDFFQSSEDKLVLRHAIARYHAFLDLTTSQPQSIFVPTLDIDLAWHTHQLNASQYESDCFKFLERFVDHDDKVEENVLSNGFDLTCREWKERFNVDYVHCGCPGPGDRVGDRLARLMLSSQPKLPLLVPPEERQDLTSATHPSDHNAVFSMQKKQVGTILQEQRKSKIAKRATRSEKHKSKVKNIDLRSPCKFPELAFLTPIPIGDSGTGSHKLVGSGIGECAPGAGLCSHGGITCGTGCAYGAPAATTVYANF